MWATCKFEDTLIFNLKISVLMYSYLPSQLCMHIYKHIYIYIHTHTYILIHTHTHNPNNNHIYIFYIYIYIHHIFFIHSSVNGNLGCFHFLAIVNSAAMNMTLHVCFPVTVFFVYLAQSGIAGSYGSSVFSFLGNLFWFHDFDHQVYTDSLLIFSCISDLSPHVDLFY